MTGTAMPVFVNLYIKHKKNLLTTNQFVCYAQKN